MATTAVTLPKLKYINLGNTGLKVSEICLGAMVLGEHAGKLYFIREVLNVFMFIL
jgi:hypothetical protein